MTIDTALLEATMLLIEEHPEQHDQAHWVWNAQAAECETTYCFAGHAALLAGAEPPARSGSWFVDERTGRLAVFGAPHAKPVADFAQGKLGLTEGQADKLFHGANTIPQLRALVDQYVAAAGSPEGEN